MGWVTSLLGKNQSWSKWVGGFVGCFVLVFFWEVGVVVSSHIELWPETPWFNTMQPESMEQTGSSLWVRSRGQMPLLYAHFHRQCSAFHIHWTGRERKIIMGCSNIYFIYIYIYIYIYSGVGRCQKVGGTQTRDLSTFGKELI